MIVEDKANVPCIRPGPEHNHIVKLWGLDPLPFLLIGFHFLGHAAQSGYVVVGKDTFEIWQLDIQLFLVDEADEAIAVTTGTVTTVTFEGDVYIFVRPVHRQNTPGKYDGEKLPAGKGSFS